MAPDTYVFINVGFEWAGQLKLSMTSLFTTIRHVVWTRKKAANANVNDMGCVDEYVIICYRGNNTTPFKGLAGDNVLNMEKVSRVDIPQEIVSSLLKPLMLGEDPNLLTLVDMTEETSVTETAMRLGMNVNSVFGEEARAMDSETRFRVVAATKVPLSTSRCC